MDIRSADSAEFKRYLEQLEPLSAAPEAGFFGPGSLSWLINGHLATYLGGMRAILLQVAHPKIAQGVFDHSLHGVDPAGRLRRTVEAMQQIVFGTRAEALRMALILNGMHGRVTGALADGGAYQANDPTLLAWVQATLVESALLSYELFGPPLHPAQREQFYAESLLGGQLFGLDPAHAPPTLGAFRAWMAAQVASPALSVGAPAQAILRSLLAGSPLHRLAAPLSSALAAGMLPPRLRLAYSLRWNAPTKLGFAASVVLLRTSFRLLPPGLQIVPAARRAGRRVAGNQSRPNGRRDHG